MKFKIKYRITEPWCIFGEKESVNMMIAEAESIEKAMRVANEKLDSILNSMVLEHGESIFPGKVSGKIIDIEKI